MLPRRSCAVLLSRAVNMLRGKVAAVGIGPALRSTRPVDRGVKLRDPQLAAAGVPIDEIDGFSLLNDRNDPVRLATALGIRVNCGSGDAGRWRRRRSAGHVAIAAAAIAIGMAQCVVAYRGCRQGEAGRYGAVRVVTEGLGRHRNEAPDR